MTRPIRQTSSRKKAPASEKRSVAPPETLENAPAVAAPELATDEALNSELQVVDLEAPTQSEETENVPVTESAPSHSEFDALFLRWKADDDPALREQLILMYRNLVVSLARRFLDRGEMFEDIVQQGMIGLIYALDHFDAGRGVRFTTFATPSILGEIRRYFRDKSWGIRVPRRMQELHQVLNRRVEQLTQQYDRAPTYAEIASALSVPIEDVIEVLEMIQTVEPVSLDEQGASEDGGILTSLADSIGAFDPNLQRWHDYAPLQAALESLPARQRLVLQAVYFQGRSQAEIARELNVSQMYVSRAQRRALARLKEILREGDV